MERRNSRNPSSWRRTWHTKGGGNFPGIALSNFLVDVIHGLTLSLDSHENRPRGERGSNLEGTSEGTTSSPQTTESCPNCLNNVFINLSKK